MCGRECVSAWVPGCECECALRVSAGVHEDDRSAGLWLGLPGSVGMCEIRVSPHVWPKQRHTGLLRASLRDLRTAREEVSVWNLRDQSSQTWPSSLRPEMLPQGLGGWGLGKADPWLNRQVGEGTRPPPLSLSFFARLHVTSPFGLMGLPLPGEPLGSYSALGGGELCGFMSSGAKAWPEGMKQMEKIQSGDWQVERICHMSWVRNCAGSLGKFTCSP